MLTLACAFPMQLDNLTAVTARRDCRDLRGNLRGGPSTMQPQHTRLQRCLAVWQRAPCMHARTATRRTRCWAVPASQAEHLLHRVQHGRPIARWDRTMGSSTGDRVSRVSRGPRCTLGSQDADWDLRMHTGIPGCRLGSQDAHWDPRMHTGIPGCRLGGSHRIHTGIRHAQ